MIVFTLMDTLFVDTRGRWCMLSSELRSVRSLRRFPSVSTEYTAVVSHASVAQLRVYPYTGSCIHCKCQMNLHEMFHHCEFHTTKEKVFTKACTLPNFFYSSLLAHCNARAASCYGKSMAMAATMKIIINFVHS